MGFRIDRGVFKFKDANNDFIPSLKLDDQGNMTKVDADGTPTVRFLKADEKAHNADFLDGLDLHTGRNNHANKVVRTNQHGYIDVGWINTTSGNTSGTITDFYVNTNDGYVRKATKAHVKSQLGLGSAAYVATSAFDASGTGAAEASAVNDRIDNEVMPLIEAPAVTSNGSTPSLNSGISAAEMRSLIGAQAAGSYQAAGTYNTIIGTDSDINTSGATIIDNIYVTDGVITSMGTRALTLANLGYTGATNANYITNNNQLTNGAGYKTVDTNTWRPSDSSPVNGSSNSVQSNWVYDNVRNINSAGNAVSGNFAISGSASVNGAGISFDGSVMRFSL